MADPNVVSQSRTATARQDLTCYVAPEEIIPERFGRRPSDPPSKESDVHSLAMTIYEVGLPVPPLGVTENFPPLSGPHGGKTIFQKK